MKKPILNRSHIYKIVEAIYRKGAMYQHNYPAIEASIKDEYATKLVRLIAKAGRHYLEH